jgi:ubiquinone/menaquinone biosynthesis C-methylase UbiE
VSEQLALETIDGLSTSAAGVAFEDFTDLATASLSPLADMRPYEQPRQNSAFPIEYAFHLLEGVNGRTVVDLGCRSGLNTVILAKLGAKVIAMDASDSSLALTEHRAKASGVRNRVTLVPLRGSSIPAAVGCADRVFCQSVLRYSDPIAVARQIRRILKPGGRAVFHEINEPALFRAARSSGPESATESRTAVMNKQYAQAISRAVGAPGEFREFWLTTTVLCQVGVACSSFVARTAQRFDAAVFRRFPLIRSLASSFVWEARKES